MHNENRPATGPETARAFRWLGLLPHIPSEDTLTIDAPHLARLYGAKVAPSTFVGVICEPGRNDTFRLFLS